MTCCSLTTLQRSCSSCLCASAKWHWTCVTRMLNTRVEIEHTHCCRRDFGGHKMRTQMMMTLQNRKKCKVYEKKDPKVPLCTIAATKPMDLVHIDLVRMEVTVETKKKLVVQKILVVTNHFSRFVQAYKVKDKRAITITKCLYDNYFQHYGFLQRLLSDQGTEFCNAILNACAST